MEDLEEETRRWLEPDETAGQLLRRTYVQPLKTGLPLVDRFIAFRGGQVGGAGVHSQSGRSQPDGAVCCGGVCSSTRGSPPWHPPMRRNPPPPRQAQVLEIASAAGVGRTTALLQVAATCILPEALHSVAFGGMAGEL